MTKIHTQKNNVGGLTIFLTFLSIILATGLIWLFFEYQNVKNNLETDLLDAQVQQEIMQAEVEKLKELVGVHIVLPDEDPILATIDDIEKLSAENPFFDGAKNGDKVLIYSTMAIIYDEDRDILVNVGPVYGDAKEVAQEVSEPIMIEVRNGSTSEGAAQAVADQLNAYDQFEVIRIDKASKTDYVGTLLVNVTGVNSTELEQIFGVMTSDMPESEYETGADVVIIIGN